MSYAAQRSLGDSTVHVGSKAASDPILAKASLDASSIMLAMAKVPQAQRLPLMQASLEQLGVGSGDVVAEMKRGLARRGANPDQVAFDAMRLAISNVRLDRGIDNIRQEIASRSGWDDTGLGTLSANDRATGCMITGGAQVVGGIASIIPVYGTIVGGVIGIGSSIAGGQLDCGREARDAATAAAAAEARLAEAQRIAAEQTAAGMAASRTRRIRTVAAGGAILLAVIGAGWLISD
jgi:hypothetical protein